MPARPNHRPSAVVAILVAALFAPTLARAADPAPAKPTPTATAKPAATTAPTPVAKPVATPAPAPVAKPAAAPTVPAPVAAPAAPPLSPAEGLAFFEQKIRPVLVEHCYSCHSQAAKTQKKLQAELFLDSAEGMLYGGESGPAIVKGKSAESLLVKALKYDGFEMPPTGKLPPAVVADFAKWVDMGAPDPRTGNGTTIAPKRVIDIAAGKQFWSFQPLKVTAPPNVKDVAWTKTPVDKFIRAAQEKQGVTPNGPTSPETLVRRAFYDLIGLPPTPEETAEFVNDKSPDAYAKLIDRLLASPRYGERWGRHWLDVARYAESGGYEFDGFRPGAYHYRDWVIRALNADLPYDEFVRMQIAGDKLKPGDYDGISAAGFFVAGPYPGQITSKTVERFRYDQLDDMLMTMGGSMLGLTLGCTRCHDHKYDPIPSTDYYSLAAALERTAQGNVPLDPNPAATREALAKYATDRKALEAAIAKFAEAELPAKFTKWQQTELPKLTEEPRWQTLVPLTATSNDTWLVLQPAGGIVSFVAGGRKKESDTYTITAETYQEKLTSLRLDALTDKALPRKGPGLAGDGNYALGDFKVTARPLDPKSKAAPIVLKLKAAQSAHDAKMAPLANAVDKDPNTSWRPEAGGRDNSGVFEIEGGLPGFPGGTSLTFELKFVGSGLGRIRLAMSTEPLPATWAGEIAPQNLGEIRAIVAAGKNTLTPALRPAMVRWFAPYDAVAEKAYAPLAAHLKQSPRTPYTDIYTTVAGGQDVFLLRRGEVDNKQGRATPGFLQVLEATPAGNAAWLAKPAADAKPVAGKPAPPTPAASIQVEPRTALANWITDSKHGAGHLLARVIVNRLWQHHFGEGLVGTPNDFGAQGERPSHPELLDWLAAELIRGGWKLKPIHKLMMTSAAYMQDGVVSEANRKLDPDNRLVWHRKPQRLQAEILRDALLAVGGGLDLKMYGPSVLDDAPRRSVYLRVKRSELIPMMTMFDAPEPTQSIGERANTTIPTQALTLMNSPFVRKMAEGLARRANPPGTGPANPKPGDLDAAISRAYDIALGRKPAPHELAAMREFVAQQTTALGGPTSVNIERALTEMCQVMLCVNEFVYVD